MIEKVIETLTPPEAWTRAAFARTASGRVIGPSCSNAVCFCIGGAVLRASPASVDPWADLIRQAILDRFPHRTRDGSIPTFNDHDDTTHEDVLAVLYRARELELAATCLARNRADAAAPQNAKTPQP